MNQFGKAFFAYKLLEWLDLAELETLLHNPKDQSFEALKRIASKILEDSRIDTTAGFQVMLGKIMADDKKREYFHEVQEHETVEKYAVIWCKVLWLCCLAVRNECTVTHNLILTPDQIRTAQELVASLDLTLDVGVDYDEAYKRSMRAAVELSGHILRQKYGIVNRIDPDTGCSKSSSYIIPRAINLLSLRPNGSFLSYLQITHVTAAIRYVLRSVLLYLVMRVMNEDEQEDEDAIDGEIAQYLSARQSTAFSYCVQVHGACKSFGLNHQLPSITWATDDFTALRLNSGALLTLTSLKDFLQELYGGAESLQSELCLGINVPTHFARDLRDVYNNTRPGYSFLSEPTNNLPGQYLWDSLLLSGTPMSGSCGWGCAKDRRVDGVGVVVDCGPSLGCVFFCWSLACGFVVLVLLRVYVYII